MRPVLHGVGVGPGAPDLVTVRVAALLDAAEVVFVPVADSLETGRAEQTVLHYADPRRVERVVFALHDREHTARREAAWDAAAAQVARWFTDHPEGRAVFATIGDPCVYSTFTYLAASVRACVGDLDVRLASGITAMQDLAARTATSLVEGREALALFPMTAGADRFHAALSRGDALVAYKFGRMLPETLAVLRATGRLGGAVYGARLGLPDEDVRPAADLDPSLPGPYLSTLIVPPRRGARGHALHDPAEPTTTARA